MTHILVIYENVEPTNIEVVRVLNSISQSKESDILNMQAIRVTAKNIGWADVIVFVRSTSRIELGLVEIAKRAGRFIVFLLDDDFMSLGSGYGTKRTGYDPLRKYCLSLFLKHVDVLWAVNELLAHKYCRLGKIKRAALSNTMVQKEEIYSTRQDGTNHEYTAVAIYVNDGSKQLFESIIKPVLPQLCVLYPNKIKLYLIAIEPNLSEFEDKMKIIYVPHMPYYEFKKYLGTERIDIGLAPLDDNGFSQYKYFNKFIEYTNAGIPAIYSGVPLYKQIIKDGINGLICENKVESWLNSISRLVEKPGLRKSLIDNAQKQIVEDFSEDRIIYNLMNDIPEFNKYHAPAFQDEHLYVLLITYHKIMYRFYRVAWWVRSVIIYVSEGNIKDLMLTVKEKLKK